ncbi:MAG: hypothetical protein MJ104_04125 [Lachnospiraceae bacterium]|nr:hypothetical protein [Lachnospiraceae bacterium]
MKKRSRAVILTGFVGLKGTAILAERYKEKIDSRYPMYLSRGAEHMADSVAEDSEKALKVIDAHLARYAEVYSETKNKAEAKGKKVTEGKSEAEAKGKNVAEGKAEAIENPVTEIADGGFLTAMWTLAKEVGQGFTLDLRKVPLKQETVEICELTEVNPYHLCSYGCIAAIVPDGLLLQEELEKQGIPSVIIGYTNSTKAHILMNDGTESHLNRPEPDEIDRLGLR